MNSRLLLSTILLSAACFGIGEPGDSRNNTATSRPDCPAIAVKNADYLILRAVYEAQTPQAAEKATLWGRQYHFNSEHRIVDLTNFELGSATLEQIETPVGPEWAISLRTTQEGEKRLYQWTAQNIDQPLGIFLDGKLISAPTVKSKLGEMILLESSFSKPDADAVLRRLKNGGAG